MIAALAALRLAAMHEFLLLGRAAVNQFTPTDPTQLLGCRVNPETV
jgi:hypothetical protein